MPMAFSTVASTSICAATAPASGLTNCGNSARTNSATLGFSRLVSRPWRNTARNGSGTATGKSTCGAFDRNAVQARASR